MREIRVEGCMKLRIKGGIAPVGMPSGSVRRTGKVANLVTSPHDVNARAQRKRLRPCVAGALNPRPVSWPGVDSDCVCAYSGFETTFSRFACENKRVRERNLVHRAARKSTLLGREIPGANFQALRSGRAGMGKPAANPAFQVEEGWTTGMFAANIGFELMRSWQTRNCRRKI